MSNWLFCFTLKAATTRAAQYANNASTNKTFSLDDITYIATDIMVTNVVINDISYDITLHKVSLLSV